VPEDERAEWRGKGRDFVEGSRQEANFGPAVDYLVHRVLSRPSPGPQPLSAWGPVPRLVQEMIGRSTRIVRPSTEVPAAHEVARLERFAEGVAATVTERERNERLRAFEEATARWESVLQKIGD
jgi:hypothetical protein